MRLYIGTRNGLVTGRLADGRWTEERRELEGHDLWMVAHRPDEPDIVFAGAYGQGLYRRTGNGRWERLPDPPPVPNQAGLAPGTLDYARVLAFDPHDPLTIYAGTEPAEVFRSTDGGDTWLNLGLRTLPSAGQWSLPYSPRGGAVRTLALPAARPSLVYGGVEQGGVILSADGGMTWSITAEGVHPDVHQVAVHPLDLDLVWAATGGGVYRSRDGGVTWARLVNDYTRAVLIHPRQPERMWIAPARYVGRQGRILASDDGGNTWQPAGGRLDVPLEDMIEAFALHPDRPDDLFAVRDNGGLLHTHVDSMDWQPVAPGIEGVRCLDLVVT